MGTDCCRSLPVSVQHRCIRAAAVLWNALQMAVQAPKTEEHASWERVNRRAERLLDTYGNAVLRLAYSHLHNSSDAEEILQDTLMKYLQPRRCLCRQIMRRPGFSGWRRI